MWNVAKMMQMYVSLFSLEKSALRSLKDVSIMTSDCSGVPSDPTERANGLHTEEFLLKLLRPRLRGVAAVLELSVSLERNFDTRCSRPGYRRTWPAEFSQSIPAPLRPAGLMMRMETWPYTKATFSRRVGQALHTLLGTTSAVGAVERL